MSATVRISRRVAALLLLTLENEGLGHLACAGALRSAYRPPVSEKKRTTRRSTRAAKGARKATKREQRSVVRDAVFDRAESHCEVCSIRLHDGDPGELDHFWGRARAESVETCWALCRQCHREKTANKPTSGWWHHAFGNHCEIWGYHAEAARARARIGSEADIATASTLSGRAGA